MGRVIPKLTICMIAQEMRLLCGSPPGPFQIIEMYSVSKSVLPILVWADGHEVTFDSPGFLSGDLRMKLEDFSDQKLKPIAKLWLERKGKDHSYRKFPPHTICGCEIRED